MNSIPSGTVTFLFTDIEGSTKLAQQYPEAMPALLARGNPSEARKYFSNGLFLQRELKDVRTLPSLLEGLANVLASLSQTCDALRLMGAAQVLRERINKTVMQVERSEYDHFVTKLSEQMDKPTFQKIWDEGRAMAVEQAIEFALEQTDE